MNKYLRFILKDPDCRLRIIIFAIALFMIYSQLGVQKSLKAELGAIKAKKDMVASIPKMEETIRANTIITEIAHPQPQIAKVEFVLLGMTIKEGVPYALIDENIYKEGDTLGDYTVVRISRGGVVLENKLKQETKNLYFTEKAVLPPPAQIPKP